MPKLNEQSPDAAAIAASETPDAADTRKKDASKAGSFEEQSGALAPGDPASKGNAEEQARLARIQASWEATLGKYLGGKAFELLREHVSSKALEGYAKQGVEAMTGQLPSLAGELGRDKGETAALTAFVKALMPVLEEQATKWVESETGQKVYAAISDWVMEHPKTVAISAGVAAIAAAVGAVLADMDVPELSQTFKIAKGLEASAGIDLGKLQSLSVQAAKAGISYKSEGLKASLSGEYKKGSKPGEDTYKASLEAGTEHEVAGGTLDTKGKATIDQDGLVTIEVDGGFKTKVKDTPLEVAAGADTKTGDKVATNVDGKISWGDKDDKTTAKGSYNVSDGSFTLKLDRSLLDGDFVQSSQYKQEKDGSVSSSTAVTSKQGERTTITAKAGENKDGMGTEAGFNIKAPKGGGMSGYAKAGTGIYSGMSAGVGYDKGAFKAQLDLAMKEESTRLSASAEYNGENGIIAKGSAAFRLDDPRLETLSTQFGYRSKDEFKTFLLDYEAKWSDENKEYAHSFGLLLERSFGRIDARLSGGLDLTSMGVQSANAELLAGYRLNEDWRALGSVGYSGDRLDQNASFNGALQLGAGFQYKDVGIRATYTPDSKAFGIGLTIPLGRRR